MPRVGDYVLSNYPCTNSVSANISNALDASDHLPVLAKVQLQQDDGVELVGAARRLVSSSAAVLPPVLPRRKFCAVLGYVRADYIKDGKMTKGRILRQQNDLADPTTHKQLKGRAHKGAFIREGTKVYAIGPKNVRTGLVPVVADVSC